VTSFAPEELLVVQVKNIYTILWPRHCQGYLHVARLFLAAPAEPAYPRLNIKIISWLDQFPAVYFATNFAIKEVMLSLYRRQRGKNRNNQQD
jgi:hypothetical protein